MKNNSFLCVGKRQLLLCTGLLGMSLFIASCHKPDIELVEQPVFDTDTTGNHVTQKTIITYTIYKDQLYPYTTYSISPEILAALKDDTKGLKKLQDFWNSEQKNKQSHEKIFRLFSDLIPEMYRKDVRYFSIDRPSPAYANMSTLKNNSLESFNLGVNAELLTYLDSIPRFKAPEYRHNTLGYSYPIYTLIHEFGHYVTSNKDQSYLQYSPNLDTYNTVPKPGSILDSVLVNYWNRYMDQAGMDCWTKHGNYYFCGPADEFVSGYASTSPAEDAAETFAHFVLLDDKPAATTAVNRKLLLFYQNPRMVAIRQSIRENLKKLGIVPRSPTMP
ncbi:putative zinc-binding metallopeptidase [Siphonobacter sp.]|uniref:putative zinc-binding metallopeptidase n=1 Tax=Siphonobacter sp. TaxID=1869184 RepID=UPI003B3A1DA4